MTDKRLSLVVSEICVDAVESVIAASHAGADRVELCSALLEGGLTPSFGMAKSALAVAGGVAVHVMIRPRGGDFLYTEAEFAAMKNDIVAFNSLGVQGFVFGMLDADGNVDSVRSAEIVSLCRPASVTFHRALDMARDPGVALDKLIELGIDRVLTSGQAPSVLEGAPVIRGLIEQAAGRIVVMPGGDITARNVARILADTGASEIHFASLEQTPGPMRFRNNAVHMGGALRPAEYDRTTTSASGIESVLSAAASQQ